MRFPITPRVLAVLTPLFTILVANQLCGLLDPHLSFRSQKHLNPRGLSCFFLEILPPGTTPSFLNSEVVPL